VGQVYPRSLDFEVVSALHQVGAAAAELRHDDAAHGRGRPPHGGLPGGPGGLVGDAPQGQRAQLRAHLRLLDDPQRLRDDDRRRSPGDQWNEGDVSCSVVRRVALPDAFFAIDGLLRRCSRCWNRWRSFPSAIAQENERNLPFLATTTILMEAVKRGAGRETAHEAIKEHSLAAAKAMRSGTAGGRPPGPPGRGPRIGLGKKALQAILAEKRPVRRGGAATRSMPSSAEVKPLARSGSRAPPTTGPRGSCSAGIP
jgi:adenylosuccinate lyase